MQRGKRTQDTIRTTLGELAAAFYETALAELKNEAAAARLAQRLVQQALRARRVTLAERPA